jgi:hypothetical protein
MNNFFEKKLDKADGDGDKVQAAAEESAEQPILHWFFFPLVSAVKG